MNLIGYAALFQTEGGGILGGLLGGGKEGGGGNWMMIVSLVLVFGVMYFLMIRPQRKKQKEAEQMVNTLAKGDKVVSIGGIHGVVHQVKDDTVVIKIDDNAKIELTKKAIDTRVSTKGGDAQIEAKPKGKAKKEGFMDQASKKK